MEVLNSVARFPCRSRMARRFRSALAARLLPLLMLTLLALPAAVQAQYNYVTNSDTLTITITGYTGLGGALTLPDKLSGKKVTCIGASVFFSCGSLTSVTIPYSITNIGDMAFAFCTNMASVTIGTNVVSIGSHAFYRCDSLTSVTIPASVTFIGPLAFLDCRSLSAITVSVGNPAFRSSGNVLFDIELTSLLHCPQGKAGSYTIPPGVTNIENKAFYYCTQLSSVTIPGSVVNIGTSAFEGCSLLRSVAIPNSVTRMGTSAFDSCLSLTNILMGTGNPAFSSTNGVLFNKNWSTLIKYPAGKAGSYTIPASVINIGMMAFAHCAGLTGITIPNGVINIGVGAFYYCTGLPSVTVPDSVTFIGEAALCGCASLTAIQVSAGNPAFSSLDGVLFNKARTALIQYPGGKAGSYAIPFGVIFIRHHAFEGCVGLTSVTIPDSVTSIGGSAFVYCPILTEAYFCGNAPVGFDSSSFFGSNLATVYYVPGTTGWPAVPNPWAGRPTARWNAMPSSCDPAEDAALTAAGSYDGFFFSRNAFSTRMVSAVRGTLNVKITDAVKGKLTAKAVLQKSSPSFSSALWRSTEPDGTKRAVLAGKGGETLDLFVRHNRVWGTLTGGTLGGDTFTFDGARNRFSDSKDAAAQTLLNSYRGYYTVALPAYDALPLGAANAAPEGSGYLTLTVGDKGSAKVAGLLADGSKVSQSSRLILFDGCGPDACVPVFTTLYSRKGWVGGLLWIDSAGRTVITDRDLGWLMRWEKPGSGPDGFSMLLDACGGFYNTAPALAAHYRFYAAANDVPYYDGRNAASIQPVFPWHVGVTASGPRLTMAKGVKPVLSGGAYAYGASENSSMATLSFQPRTGIFKGKFNLYYDFLLSERLQHKAVSVSYVGVLTPARDAAFEEEPAGQGYYLVPDKAPAWSRYRLSRSYPVYLDAAP